MPPSPPSPGMVANRRSWSSGSIELEMPLGYTTSVSSPSGSSHTWWVRPGNRLQGGIVERRGQPHCGCPFVAGACKSGKQRQPAADAGKAPGQAVTPVNSQTWTPKAISCAHLNLVSSDGQ